ncbi:MAG: hypothetical protein KJZ79_10395 [Bryobacteraceae bacterium]|nr:hypothetical protein [Bryobacteraceae bacterium]
MAFGSQTKRLGVVALLACAPLMAESLELGAEHGRWRWRAEGVLRLDDDGLHFNAPGRRFMWKWVSIQRLELLRDRVIVTGYRDEGWMRLYADEREEFRFTGTPDVEQLYAFTARRMDQRLVARLALPPREALWRVRVKLVRRGRGAHGELIIEPARVLFVAQGLGESRVWRDDEIDLISSSGPHQFSLTARPPDGNYEFQLKQALVPEQYEALWQRLNRPRGLELLANQPKENQP